MDPLRQNIALQMGLNQVDAIEAKVALDAAQRNAADLRAKLAERDAELEKLRKAEPLTGGRQPAA